LTPKTGFTLTGVNANFFTVEGASAINGANSGIITATFFGSVLNLDATKIDSYSGTGTTWTNLSNQSLNATITGSPTFNRNSGFTFNGTSSEYARVAHSNELTFTNQQSYSVEIWFNPAASQVSLTLATLVEKWNSANQSRYPYAVRYAENTGSLSFAAYDGSNNPTITSSGFDVNTWHHAIGVYDMQNQQLKMYHNGVESVEAVPIDSLGNISNTSSIGIGHRIGTSGEAQFVYKGQIGQIRIYNKALTINEIQNSYNETRPRFLNTVYLRADTYSGSGDIINAVSSVNDGIMGASKPAFDSANKNFIFNGSTLNQIIIDDSQNIEPGSGSFSLEVWFKYDGLNSPIGSQVIVGKFSDGGASQNVSYSIRINSTSNIFAQFGSGSGSGANLVVNSSNYQLDPGKWYHFIYVFTNGGTKTIQTFINGKSEGDPVTHSLSSILNHSFPLYIGSYNGGEYSQHFNGLLREFRYYNAALTSAQVTSIYANRNVYLD
jgi:hypothetical protein